LNNILFSKDHKELRITGRHHLAQTPHL